MWQHDPILSRTTKFNQFHPLVCLSRFATLLRVERSVLSSSVVPCQKMSQFTHKNCCLLPLFNHLRNVRQTLGGWTGSRELIELASRAALCQYDHHFWFRNWNSITSNTTAMVAWANCVASAGACLDDHARMSACVEDANTRLVWYLKTVQHCTPSCSVSNVCSALFVDYWISKRQLCLLLYAKRWLCVW